MGNPLHVRFRYLRFPRNNSFDTGDPSLLRADAKSRSLIRALGLAELKPAFPKDTGSSEVSAPELAVEGAEADGFGDAIVIGGDAGDFEDAIAGAGDAV
jgi:hypothetical protein